MGARAVYANAVGSKVFSNFIYDAPLQCKQKSQYVRRLISGVYASCMPRVWSNCRPWVGVGEHLSGQTEKERHFDRVSAIHQASQLPSFSYTNQQIKLLDRRMFIILMMQVGEEWRAGRARPENEGDDRSLELIRISEEVSIIMATAETFKTLSSGSRKLPETSTR